MEPPANIVGPPQHVIKALPPPGTYSCNVSRAIAHFQDLLHFTRSLNTTPTRDLKYAVNTVTRNQYLSKRRHPSTFSSKLHDTFKKNQAGITVKRSFTERGLEQRRSQMRRFTKWTQASDAKAVTILCWDGNINSTLALPCLEPTTNCIKFLEASYSQTYPYEHQKSRLMQLSRRLPVEDFEVSKRYKENDTSQERPLELDDIFDFVPYKNKIESILKNAQGQPVLSHSHGIANVA